MNDGDPRKLSVQELWDLLDTGDQGAGSFFTYSPTECPNAPHRGPEGPNEDLGQCRLCLCPSWSMRPEGEQFGLHLDDCSLPLRHESFCKPGGDGHAPLGKVRGYCVGFDADIAQARERFSRGNQTDA